MGNKTKAAVKVGLMSLWRGVLFFTAGSMVYMLLGALFAWMFTWSWFFIALIGIGGISSIIGLGQVGIAWGILRLTMTEFERIILFGISMYLLYFSIDAVWHIGQFGAKAVTVKIIASLVFSSIFIPCALRAFMKGDAN